VHGDPLGFAIYDPFSELASNETTAEGGRARRRESDMI
jgi:hypothetical protein